MNNIVVDYVYLFNVLEEEINIVLNTLKAPDSGLSPEVQKEINKIHNFSLSDEQNYIKTLSNGQKYDLYFVVQFGVGTTNYGSSVLPIAIQCMGLPNCIKPAQILLSAFAARWTTLNLLQGETTENEQMLQIWNTPEVSMNFNETNETFRSLYRISGNIVIGQQAVRLGTLTYIYGTGENDKEIINVMAFRDTFNNNLDPQPFGNTHGFTQSETNFSTYTFTITTYSLNNRLHKDLLEIAGYRYRTSSSVTKSTVDQNKTFILKLDFNNGYNNLPNAGESAQTDDKVIGSSFFSEFHLVNFSTSQELGAIPSLSVSFTH